jgi:hypothetical protein
MDNLPQQLLQQIHHAAHDAAHHAVDEAVGSAPMINRVVGESMRHIAGVLNMNSTSYLPVRPEEILVKPEKFSSVMVDAIVLINRVMPSENSFMVLFNSKDIDGQRHYDITMFRPDEFFLNRTKFIQIPNDIGAELVRQANLIIKGEGVTLLQAVMLRNYFTAEAQAPADTEHLFSSDLVEAAGEPAPAEQAPQAPESNAIPNTLPAVDEGLLI